MSQTGGSVGQSEQLTSRYLPGDPVILNETYRFLRNGQRTTVVDTMLIKGVWHVILDFAPTLPVPESMVVKG